MTISLTKPIASDNRNNLSVEAVDMDPIAEDFAAFLSMPVLVPPPNPPAKILVPEALDERLVEAKPNSSVLPGDGPLNTFSPKRADTLNPLESAPRLIAEHESVRTDKTFIGKIDQKVFHGDLTLSKNLGVQPVSCGQDFKAIEFKTNLRDAMAFPLNEGEDSKLVSTADDVSTQVYPEYERQKSSEELAQKTEENFKPIDSSKYEHYRSSIHLGGNSDTVKTDGMQPATYIDGLRLKRKIEPFICIKNEPIALIRTNKATNTAESTSPDQIITSDEIPVPQETSTKISPELFVENEKRSLTQLRKISNPVSTGSPEQLDVTNYLEPEEEYVAHLKTVLLSEGYTNPPARPQFKETAVIQRIPKSQIERTSIDLPVSLNKVSDILSADDSSKTSSASDLVISRLMVEQNPIDFSRKTQMGLGVAEHPNMQTKGEADVTEVPSNQNFTDFINSFSKHGTTVTKVQLANDLQSEVFEQIEPRILELAVLNQTDNEKRIFRMRLNPAELGTVEITLEKNAAGKISAYFQTESESTSQILNESMAQLRSSLENAGCQVGELEISCRSFSSNEDSRNQGRSHNFGNPERMSDETSYFEGNPINEDDKQTRLVSLRA